MLHRSEQVTPSPSLSKSQTENHNTSRTIGYTTTTDCPAKCKIPIVPSSSMSVIKFHKVPELLPNREVRTVRTEQLCIIVCNIILVIRRFADSRLTQPSTARSIAV